VVFLEMHKFIVLAAGVFAAAAHGAALPPIPATPKVPVVDVYHGVAVVDNYRWLESNSDPKVKAWSRGENARARAFIDALPNQAAVRARLEELIRSTSVSYSLSTRAGGVIFAVKEDPKRQQPTIVTLKSENDLASERTLLDPNLMDSKGGTEFDWFVVSNDGRLLGVSLSKGGSESGDLHVYDVPTMKEVGEAIPHVQNGTAGGSVAFTPDNSGFWYTRYPRGHDRAPEDMQRYQQVWFHTIGADQATDHYEMGRDLPKIAEISLKSKEDGKWILATVKNGDGGEVEFFLRPTAPGARWIQLSRFSDHAVLAAFGEDDCLYLMSRAGSPKGRVLRLALGSEPRLADAALVVPESEGAVEDLVATRTRLYVSYLEGGPSRLRVFDTTDWKGRDVPIPPVSAVSEVVKVGGDDVVFQDESYVAPPAVYRYSAATGEVSKTVLAVTSIANYADCDVERQYAISKDGTRVPLNIIKLQGTHLDGRNPTILYAYGGYGISETPHFSAWRRVWVEQGGVFVTANIRGGGDYGDQWHLDGNLLKKQNDYDDFYACARWLINHGYTSAAKLGILGGSNGGLLMGAALTQHPETYRAVVSMVGVYDMLRVELTPNGAFNVTEYGTVKDPDQFKALYGYSPYHHVVDGVRYPSILLMTGDNDPRVDPWHSRKFCARLQAASGSSNPILLRTSAASGHGIGSSLSELIGLRADMVGFFIQELGVDFHPPRKA
jgi:prolyl oligopeptidase